MPISFKMKLLALILLLASLNPAWAGPSLREAFYAHGEIRKIEERIALLSLSEAAEWEKEKQKQKLEAALTEARIHFHSFQLANSPDLTPAEAMLLNRKQGKLPAGKALKLSDNFLEENFPEAASFSLLEWELLEEWFGKDLVLAHLRQKFPARTATKSVEEEKLNPESVKIIFVDDPFSPKRKMAKEKEIGDAILQLSQFPNLEQQAEELKIRLENIREPFVIVTKGRASATFQKLLDLQPQLRVDPRVRGWINWEGNLSGKKLLSKANGRQLASLQNQPAKNLLEIKAKRALYLLRKEDLERQPGLGKGFPILNLLSSSTYPRCDSIVSDGGVMTFSAKDTPPLREAVYLLVNPHLLSL